ncbi:HEPN domain-containing protein [Chloroflexus sp.]|uniref:HEPN domain-containing protein n=1 Tax=Chloroflexus sp. TaxID=1904827 RepID=UPI00298F285D|nr:HEPN domain-containing protein [Chloroflexus sp.]MCS6888432.1 HEPN domain-containing protein [Chloroflexus sp.]MDW8405779.1 HEPN domain-containing protein [Chloroflexus sp.]
MPPRNSSIPGDPAEWLRRARSDLAIASIPLPPDGVYEDLCFHAQQAAEKAIKAIYQHYQWRFDYTHDIKELLAGLHRKGLAIPPEINEAATLTIFAHQLRYPSVAEPVSEQECAAAVALARQV